MAQPKHDRLRQELLGLKLNHIAENYRDLLDEAARKNTPMLDVLLQLFVAHQPRNAIVPWLGEYVWLDYQL